MTKAIQFKINEELYYPKTDNYIVHADALNLTTTSITSSQWITFCSNLTKNLRKGVYLVNYRVRVTGGNAGQQATVSLLVDSVERSRDSVGLGQNTYDANGTYVFEVTTEKDYVFNLRIWAENNANILNNYFIITKIG